MKVSFSGCQHPINQICMLDFEINYTMIKYGQILTTEPSSTNFAMLLVFLSHVSFTFQKFRNLLIHLIILI